MFKPIHPLRLVQAVLPFVIAVASVLHSSAQTTTQKIELPKILPASPEATAFVKAGLGVANLSTGADTANIPLYTIKVRDFTFPISLSYSTQGLKADESSSRVGQNWVLNSYSIITRSVKGEPDEYSQRMAEPSDYNATTDALFNYYSNGSTYGSGYDTQPDEFLFNCNGFSGKFVLDNNYVARATSTSNVKIDVSISVTPLSTSGNINSITLTAPDGVKYLFGNAFEKSTSNNLFKTSQYKAITKTSFFLDQIILPTGETITFTYNPISTQVATGITETLTAFVTRDSDDCGWCSNFNSYSSTTDQVSYTTQYLSKITVSNGLTVNFDYVSKATSSGGNCLTALTVPGVKKYGFEYYDTPGRFFLTKVTEMSLDPHQALNLSYTLDYNNLDQVPAPITYSQDYLGFYNGSSSSWLIPNTSLANINFDFRNPSSASVYGTLASIQYPTGGTEQFIYEPNTEATQVARNGKRVYKLEGPGGGSNGSYVPQTYTLTNITVPFDQTVKINLQAYDTDPNDNTYDDAPEHQAVSISISDNTGSSYNKSTSMNAIVDDVYTLLAGHTYTLTMTCKTYTSTGLCTIAYNIYQTPVYDVVNVARPGVRLSQLKYFDASTQTGYSKYYTYAKLGSLTESTGSFASVNFLSSTITRKYCGTYGSQETQCTLNTYSSSSTGMIYGFTGNVIYYRTVIESDSPTLEHGGTEYTFYPNESGYSYQTVHGNSVPYLEAGQYPTLAGTLFKKRIFNSDKVVVQEQTDTYETLYSGTPVASVYIRKNFEPVATMYDRMEAFDALRTQYAGSWNRLKTQTVTTTTNGISLTQKTDYRYGSTANILPDTIVTTDSKGVEIRTVKKYPNTYVTAVNDDPSTAVYSNLTALNIVTPVVQETSLRSGALTQQRRVLYKNWSANVITPERIQVKASPTDNLHDALVFKKYDTQGNVAQLQKINDVMLVYLWDSLLSEPIAEIRNALPTQTAYTSFENLAYGNWKIVSGGTVTTGEKFTGTQCFTGTIQKKISATGNYTVTAWVSSTSSAPVVNGLAGVKLWNTNGWDLYQWDLALTSPATVTVGGTLIDEVRLLPKGAEMTTFTYKPFVGVTSKNELNNRISFYEYDLLNRLTVIKDQDGNVIRTYDYHYQKQ